LGIYYFAQYEMCQFPFCVLSRIAIKPVSYGSFMFVFLNASSKDDEEYDHLPQYLVKRLNQNLLITDRYVDPSGQLQQQTIDAGVLI
jgi:hypothetical protein